MTSFSDEQVLIEYLALVERLGLTDVTAAALIGISPHTARVMRLGRVLPMPVRCRAALRLFVERNRNAKTRSDLRLAG